MKVALCLIAKMENHYIKEYVEYYKNIGFDNIILYDNNDIDGEKFEDVINDHIKSGFVILKNVRGYKNYQKYAYKHCYNEYKNNFDWIAFFDSDEFIEFEDKTETIKSFLQKQIYSNFNVIRLNWKVFDDNDIIKINNNYSIKRFTHCVGINSSQCKSIIRTNINEPIFYAHGIKNDNIPACNVLGEPCNNSSNKLDTINWSIAWINHYRLKTIEEFIRKNMIRKDMVDANNYKSDLDYFWKSNKKTKEKEEFANKLIKELNIN